MESYKEPRGETKYQGRDQALAFTTYYSDHVYCVPLLVCKKVPRKIDFFMLGVGESIFLHFSSIFLNLNKKFMLSILYG